MTAKTKIFAIARRLFCFSLCAALLAVSPSSLKAQEYWTLDLNVSLLQPVAKDASTFYRSSAQPVTLEYYIHKKFDHLYFGVLPSLRYQLSSSLSLGLQTGIYGHLNEYFSGYSNRYFVSVPVMATGQITVSKTKSGRVGLQFAAGPNFFNMQTFPVNLKNGWVSNGSVFYATGKSVFKAGIEQQSDNEIVYYVSPGPYTQNETLTFDMRRTAISLCYGYTLYKKR